MSGLPVIVLTRLFAGLLVARHQSSSGRPPRAILPTVETYVVQGAINADGSLNVTADHPSMAPRQPTWCKFANARRVIGVA